MRLETALARLPDPAFDSDGQLLLHLSPPDTLPPGLPGHAGVGRAGPGRCRGSRRQASDGRERCCADGRAPFIGSEPDTRHAYRRRRPWSTRCRTTSYRPTPRRGGQPLAAELYLGRFADAGRHCRTWPRHRPATGQAEISPFSHPRARQVIPAECYSRRASTKRCGSRLAPPGSRSACPEDVRALAVDLAADQSLPGTWATRHHSGRVARKSVDITRELESRPRRPTPAPTSASSSTPWASTSRPSRR